MNGQMKGTLIGMGIVIVLMGGFWYAGTSLMNAIEADEKGRAEFNENVKKGVKAVKTAVANLPVKITIERSK